MKTIRFFSIALLVFFTASTAAQTAAIPPAAQTVMDPAYKMLLHKMKNF
jgi:hypothetical protein